MTARQVYERQEALRDAEERLSELAILEAEAQRKGALVSSGDYMKGPEGRAVEALREEVRAAQAEVGGVVYRIPGANLGLVREKLDKLAKRANKLGVGEVAYTVDPEVERVESKLDPMLAMVELGYVPRFPTSYRYVILNAAPVKLEGWMFLATLTVEPGGVMVSKVPAFAHAWSLHREGRGEAPQWNPRGDEAEEAAQARLDALNLGVYTDEARATLCEHCGLARRRTKTHLVEHAETGEIKQVGSNCLRDFLGTDPHTILRYARYLDEIAGSLDDDEIERGGAGGKAEIGTEEYVTHVCTMLRTVGWIGASEDYKGRPTRDQAMSNLRNYGKVEDGRPLYEEITEADHERAKAAIEWAREHLGAKKHEGSGLNDFEHNLYIAARGETLPSKGLGVVAYLPVAHARFEEREIERAARNAETLNEFYGNVGDRETLTLKVTHIFESAGHYGTTYVTVMRDEAGRAFKWSGSYELERGETYEGTWTIKAHKTHEKYGKQTIVNRPSKNLTRISGGDEPQDDDSFEADMSTFVARDGSHTNRGGQVYFPEGEPEGTFEVIGYSRGTTARLRPVAQVTA